MEDEQDEQRAADEVTGQIEPVPGEAAWTDPNPTGQYGPAQAQQATPDAGAAGGDPYGRGFATGSPVFGDRISAPTPRGQAGQPGAWNPYQPYNQGQAGWYPPPPPPPGAQASSTTGSTAPRGNKTRRRLVRGGTALFVVGATMAAGIGVGHLVWRPAPNNAAEGTTSTNPGGSNNGSNGSNGSGSGNGGTSPGGSTGSTGQLPFGGGFPGAPGFTNPNTGSTGSGSTSTAPGSPTNSSSVAVKVDPALVDVNTVIDYGSGEAAGTGIVLTSNGEVLTNNHVINGATSISVTDVGNGTTYKAKVVGYDRTDDIAVIQLQGASGLQTANIGDSSKLTVGQAVVALGNAGGVGGKPSVAGGSITNLGQSITASDEGGGNSEQLHGLIEINANIQPGDSGGSLANSSGQVVGIDTAASNGLTFQSQTTDGYAIPINTAMSIASEIENGQASSTVHIGASAFIGIRVSATGSNASGAAVSGVLSGTPASAAGLANGDVITAVDGQSVSSADGLTQIMVKYHPGDTVRMTWTDPNGQQHSASLTLTKGPAA